MKYIALWLVGICVAVFILQNIYPSITDSFALVSANVLQAPWTLITHMFLHGSFEHLFYNMFALALFGTILEGIIGSKRFLILYFVSGLIAALGSVMFYSASIGASGAIMGVLGCLAVLRPKMTVYLSYIPMPMIIATVVWAAGDLVGMFAPDEIAHAAHLFGMVFGIAVGLYYRKRFADHTRKYRIGSIPENEAREWENKWIT